MIIPGVLAVASPLLVGFILARKRWPAVDRRHSSRLLTGSHDGQCRWRLGRAKKYIEAGEMGGKGPPHKSPSSATPLATHSDTSGPSLNILIKLMSIVACLCCPSAPAC